MARLASTLLVLLALPLTACGYDSHDRYEHVSYETECGTVREAVIDTNAGLETDLGVGAGAFVEYVEGGSWRVFTTCDTFDSGYSCYWDMIVSPLEANAILSSSPEALEGPDSLSWETPDSLRFLAYTDYEYDGFSFEAVPGVGMRVDVLLDSGCGNRYLFWQGDGARHEGAPSNPMDLIPSAP
jgi:hypothetical protein